MTSPGETAATLARVHAACFPDRPRAWTAQEFDSLLQTLGCFLVTRDSRSMDGFLLGRVVLDEAELLTLAVAPDARRRGLGRALLQGFEQAATERGARHGFLEVASDNPAAQALYHKSGWHEAGIRKGYYGPGIHAHVLKKPMPREDTHA